MDIVRFKGGLGNQMFQYALVEALRSRGRMVGCSLGFYKKHPDAMPFVLNKVFKGVNLEEIDDMAFDCIDNRWKEVKKNPEDLKKVVGNPKKRFFYVEENAHTYYEEVFQTDNCVFVGYWQSEKYFKHIRNIILNYFTFFIGEPVLYELGEKLAADNYVSVHIRRGDYLKYPQVANICTDDYYCRAIDYSRKRIPNVKFVFFSDDIGWVREKFSSCDTIICYRDLFAHYEDWYDMYLMTKCRGNIIANSTFSWWGAWLNQNREPFVIAPKRWREQIDTPDIWCERWVRL